MLAQPNADRALAWTSFVQRPPVATAARLVALVTVIEILTRSFSSIAADRSRPSRVPNDASNSFDDSGEWPALRGPRRDQEAARIDADPGA